MGKFSKKKKKNQGGRVFYPTEARAGSSIQEFVVCKGSIGGDVGVL
jgi:hypothetical protein